MKSLPFRKNLIDKIENSHLVDPLPYIDPFDEKLKKRSEDLVKEEMKLFQPRNYLGRYNIDMTEHFTEKEDLAISLLPRTENEAELIEVSRNYDIRKEQLSNEKLNLKIIQEFNEEAYKAHINSLESISSKLDSDIKEAEKSIQSINKERKSLQDSAKSTFSDLQNQFIQLLFKNQSLSATVQEKRILLETLKKSN